MANLCACTIMQEVETCSSILTLTIVVLFGTCGMFNKHMRTWLQLVNVVKRIIDGHGINLLYSKIHVSF